MSDENTPTTRGPGRPPTHPEGATRRVCATLPAAQLVELDAIAEFERLSRSEVLARAVRHFLGFTRAGIRADVPDRP